MAKFNLQSVKRWRFEPQSPPTAVSLASLSGDAVIAGSDGLVFRLDRTGKEVFKVKLPSPAFDVEVTSGAEYTGLLCEDKKLRVLDKKGTLLWDASVDSGACAVDISRRAGSVVVGGSRKKLYIFRLDGKLKWEGKLDFTIYDIAFSSGIGCFAAVSTTGVLGFLDNDGTLRWQVSIGRRCRGVDVSESGHFIILPVYDSGIRAYNMEGGYIGEYDVLAEVLCASINASGNLIYLADERNRLILLNKNAEVIWHLELQKKVIGVHCDDSGALCLAFLEGGEIIFLELVADETPYLDFLEMPVEEKRLKANLIWRKNFRPILDSFDPLQTDISPEGGYITVFGGKRLSVYDENSFLKWNDTIEEAAPVIVSAKDEHFFFVNTDTYLYRYNYRKGRRWKLLLSFKRLYSPEQKGNLYATTDTELFSITRDGEILWRVPLCDEPLKAAPSPDGALVGVLLKGGRIEVYNSSGGLSFKKSGYSSARDLFFFGGCIILLLGERDIARLLFPAFEESLYSTPSEVKSLVPLSGHLIIQHRLGGATVLDKNWEKKLELPDDKGRLFIVLDRDGLPIYLRVTGSDIKLYNTSGAQVQLFSTDKPVIADTLKHNAGRLIFFAGTELYSLDIGSADKDSEIVKYLEFSSGRGIYKW